MDRGYFNKEDYKKWLDKIEKILQKNMTERGFLFWKGLNEKIPMIWHRPVSSSFKYHQKEDLRIPTIAEHVFEMIYAAVPILGSINIKSKTEDCDTILLAILLHDGFKYGKTPDESKFTNKQHDRIVADFIGKNKLIFEQLFQSSKIEILEEIVRYHSGPWSPDAKKDFCFSNVHPYVMFVHLLDNLSCKNLLKNGEYE